MPDLDDSKLSGMQIAYSKDFWRLKWFETQDYVDAIDRLNGRITKRKHVKVTRCINKKNRLLYGGSFSLQIAFYSDKSSRFLI